MVMVAVDVRRKGDINTMGEAALQVTGMMFDSKFENGFISLGKKSEGGGSFPEPPAIPDESTRAKETLESRIEDEIEVKFVENERLIFNGRKLNFHREGDVLYTFLGASGRGREWRLANAEKRMYASLNYKGEEETAYVVDVTRPVVEKSEEIEKKPEVKIENLVKFDTKKIISRGRTLTVYESQGTYYTIQGKGGAPCAWGNPSEDGAMVRYNTKGEKVEGTLIDVQPSLPAPKAEKPAKASEPPPQARQKMTDFQPSYFWVKLAPKLRF